MRVLHVVSDHKVSGPAAAALSLVKALRSAGVEATLLCEGGGELESSAAEAKAACGVTLPPESGSVFAANVVLRALAGAAKATGAELIHIHRSPEHVAAARLRGRGGPPIVRSWNRGEGELPPLLTRWLMRWRTTELIVPSERAAGVFRKAFPGMLVSAVPGIVDAAAFRPGRDAELRRQMGAEESDVLVGAVGRFAPERRLDEFLMAFPGMKQPAGLRLLGVALGRGPQRPELERMASDFAPDGRLRVVETTQAFPAQLSQLDIGIQMAPGSDGTCRTALEMMACGLAVVVGSGGSLSEVVEHGKTGLVVDMKESARLAEAVSALASDAARRLSLGAAARQTVTERNSPSAVAARYADIYRRALGGGA